MTRTALLLTIVLLLAACAAGATGQEGKWNCNDGLCLSAEIIEPPPEAGEIQPVITLAIEVQSERDIPELGISIWAPRLSAIEGSPESASIVREIATWEDGIGWKTEIKAGETLRFVQKIRLLKAGWIDLYAYVSTKQGLRTGKSFSVEFTPEKIVINPTPYPGAISSAVTMSPEEVATLHAVMTQDAVLTATALFPSPLTTPTPHFVSPLPTPAPASP